MGFNEANLNGLNDALVDVAKRGEVKSAITSAFGIR